MTIDRIEVTSHEAAALLTQDGWRTYIERRRHGVSPTWVLTRTRAEETAPTRRLHVHLDYPDDHWAQAHVPEGGALDRVEVHFIGPDGLPNFKVVGPTDAEVYAEACRQEEARRDERGRRAGVPLEEYRRAHPTGTERVRRDLQLLDSIAVGERRVVLSLLHEVAYKFDRGVADVQGSLQRFMWSGRLQLVQDRRGMTVEQNVGGLLVERVS